ncbi:MAG: hypothetical protein ACI4GV_09180 [Acutalibacteraceae bacterium]
MRNVCKKAVDKIGTEVTVCTSNGTRKGNAVIYPVRYEKNSEGGIENTFEGRSEPDRYTMYCDSELMKYAKRGDRVNDGKNSYLILWIDEFSCRSGSYIKSYIRKVIEGE